MIDFKRKYNIFDNIILEIDHGIRAVFSKPKASYNPAQNIPEAALTSTEKNHVAGLMRVNLAGEICAQALYKSQALLSQSHELKDKMQKAALDEEDHLAWCSDRLLELNKNKSIFNIFWYCGSWTIGVFAALAGDEYNLGFVAETEDQVSAHLKNHIDKLPSNDNKTRAILAQMQKDEEEHAILAKKLGALDLPNYIKYLMYISSKCMTNLSYYI